MQVLAVAGDDEQRVVDADAEADHRRHLDGELGHREHGGGETDHADAAEQPEDRGAEREAHRQHRPEGDEEDDDGGEEAERLAGRELELGEQLAAVLDGEAVDAHFLAEFLHLVGQRQLLGLTLHLVGDLGEGDGLGRAVEDRTLG